jgi:hypothetical protein
VKRFVLVLPLALAVGCQSPTATSPSMAPLRAEGEGDPGEIPVEPDPYESQNGTQLLGFSDPNISYFMFTHGEGHAYGDGILATDSAVGTELTGASLQAVRFDQTRLQMRIARVLPPDQDSRRWRYDLEAYDAPSGEWRTACAEPPTLYPAAKLGTLAIALPGSWNADGTYAQLSERFVLACASGVVAKCTGWGYPGDDALRGDTIGGNWSVASGPDLLQACTRLARADYCANGSSRTIDGTPIHVYDIFGGPLRPERPVPGFKFEAAWSGHAWKIPASGPAQQPAFCLSKLRWSTLPLGGDCPLELPDPRLPKSEGHFCEEYDQRELENMGAVFFNDSPVLDAGLYTWSNAGANAWLTTTHFLPRRVPAAPEPFGPDLTVPRDVEVPMLEPRFEGALFRVDVRPPAGTVMLSTWFCPDVPSDPKYGGDFMTTSAQPDVSCIKIGDEGFVYSPADSYAPGTRNRVPLMRYETKVNNPNLGDHTMARSITTTRDEATMRAAGWQPAALEGYLPR